MIRLLDTQFRVDQIPVVYVRRAMQINDASSLTAAGAAAEAHGEWPRPALAMMTGAISPEELLKLMDDKKGDERQMALAEGYFYLGQHYLIAGDTKMAQSYFQKTRDLDIFIYVEHVAAGFELQQLAKDGAATSTAKSGVGGTTAQ